MHNDCTCLCLICEACNTFTWTWILLQWIRGTPNTNNYVPTLTSNIVKAELQGLWEGVMVARKRFPSTKLRIEGNSSTVINSLSHDSPSSSISSQPLLRDVIAMLCSAPSWKAAYIYREGNEPFNWLVTQGLVHSTKECWFSNFPRNLIRLCNIDVSDCTFIRNF